MDHQVSGVQEALDGVEPVQHQVLQPPGDDSRAKHPLVFGVGGRAERRSSRRGRVDSNLFQERLPVVSPRAMRSTTIYLNGVS